MATRLHLERKTMSLFVSIFVSNARYRKYAFRSALLLYLAVLVFGSIPGARAEVGELASGWLLHTLTYSAITLLLFCGLEGSAWSRASKSFLIVVAMGAIDEGLQSFFPYRNASVMDWFVDIGAALFSAAVLWWIWLKQAPRLPDSNGNKNVFIEEHSQNSRSRRTGSDRIDLSG